MIDCTTHNRLSVGSLNESLRASLQLKRYFKPGDASLFGEGIMKNVNYGRISISVLYNPRIGGAYNQFICM
jgi:hypothetical protein